jgi:hypothetical protein
MKTASDHSALRDKLALKTAHAIIQPADIHSGATKQDTPDEQPH